MNPKKSLGQNFLTSEPAIARITEAGELTAGDTVLEIGPGKGVLTEKLLEKAGRVIAVEKDAELIPLLEEKFSEKTNFSLISQDILEFNPGEHGLEEGNYKLIANIPYYITGEILRKFLETGPQPSRMVLLVQKEVAERITAKDSHESILSISVKAFGTPKMAGIVKAGSFFPKPSVDSAILIIANISRKLLSNGQEQGFFDIVRRGFAHKRKLLRRNLDLPLGALPLCNISETARAEELSLENWLCLAKETGKS